MITVRGSNLLCGRAHCGASALQTYLWRKQRCKAICAQPLWPRGATLAVLQNDLRAATLAAQLRGEFARAEPHATLAAAASAAAAAGGVGENAGTPFHASLWDSYTSRNLRRDAAWPCRCVCAPRCWPHRRGCAPKCWPRRRGCAPRGGCGEQLYGEADFDQATVWRQIQAQ